MKTSKSYNLNENEKAQLRSNDESFTKFYDSLIGELDQASPQAVESNDNVQQQEVAQDSTVDSKPVSTRASVADVASKTSMGKPSNQPVAMSTETKEKSVDDILADINSLSEEEYHAKYLTPKQ